jgi:hypothetical protein
MRMLRSVIAAAGLGLALLPGAAFADSDTTDLILAGDTGANPCENFRLSFSTGSQTGGCSDATFGGYLGTTEDLIFGAVDGLPLTLDPARKIHVQIDSSMFLGDNPKGTVGDETVTVTLTGKRVGSNATITLGNASKTTPTAERVNKNNSTVTFDIQPAASTAGVFKSLTLAVSVGGAILGGYVSLDGSSFVSFPIIDGSEPVIDEG